MGEETNAGALSPPQWTRHLVELATTGPLDVLVVGGGVVGAGAALDAASRGLRVGLLEAQDWASGSSGRSSKLAHGGLRYLRMLEIGLVREALAERAHLLANAPHLVQPARFLYPVRHRIWEMPYVRLGVGAYDLLARLSHGELGGHEVLSRQEALHVAPSLRRRSLVGGVVYGDAQVDDVRLVLGLVRTAVARGALAVSRAEVVGLLDERGRVGGVRVRLAETGEELEVRARAVVLAAGVWNDELARRLGMSRQVALRPSKGVHLLVRGPAITSSAALIVPAGASVLFVLPWGANWIVGTTDTPWDYARGRPVASRGDIEVLLERANRVLARPLRREDVLSVYAGLRPLLRRAGRSTSRLSREHAVTKLAPGLVSVSGGKLTTYRVMAAEAVDAALAAGGMPPAPSRTASLRLLGAPDGAGLPPGLGQAEVVLDRASATRFFQRYGLLAREVVEAIVAMPSLGREIAGAPGLLRGEVRHAITHEGARHLEDVLVRRSRVSIETEDRGVHAAAEVAALMAGPLGWDDRALRREVEGYRRTVRDARVAEGASGDGAAVAALGEADLPVP